MSCFRNLSACNGHQPSLGTGANSSVGRTELRERFGVVLTEEGTFSRREFFAKFVEGDQDFNSLLSDCFSRNLAELDISLKFGQSFSKLPRLFLCEHLDDFWCFEGA